jgi:hypothetical protein
MEASEAVFYVADVGTEQQFWGSDLFKRNVSLNALAASLFGHIPALINFAFIILLITACRKNKLLALFFAATFSILFLFTYCVFDKGYLRHTGAFFILVIIAMWLYRTQRTAIKQKQAGVDYVFILILLAQAFSGVSAIANEIKYSFSNSKTTAAFLVESDRKNNSILVEPDYVGTSLLHYAEIKKVFYIPIEKEGSFIKFNTQRKRKSRAQVYHFIDLNKIETLVFNEPQPDLLLNNLGYQLVYQAPGNSTTRKTFMYTVEGNSVFYKSH